MTCICRTLLSVVIAISAVSLSFSMTFAQISMRDELVDFDRPVGFSQPLRVTVFRAVRDGSPIFLFLPSFVEVGQGGGVFELFLGYMAPAGRFPEMGQLTGELELGRRADVETAMAEIRRMHADAVFAVPVPAASRFGLRGPGVGWLDLMEPGEVLPLTGSFGFSVEVPALLSRALLAPLSYKQAVLSLEYRFSVRGVSRTNGGAEVFETRTFVVGAAAFGFCATQPLRATNHQTRSSGCIHPVYPRELIRSIQRGLLSRGYDPGKIDGIFGARTEAAIRDFQSAEGIVVDGIPSLDLAGLF